MVAPGGGAVCYEQGTPVPLYPNSTFDFRGLLDGSVVFSTWLDRTHLGIGDALEVVEQRRSDGANRLFQSP